MTPDVSPAQTRILLAVLAAPRSTVRSVAAEAGCAVSTAHAHLKRLRNMGLVTWTDGQDGTLRAAAEVVADLRECGEEQSNGRSKSDSLGVTERAPATASTAPGRGPDLTGGPSMADRIPSTSRRGGER